MKLIAATLALSIAGLASGCMTIMDHPDPVVSGAAEVGAIAGAVLAVPLDVVALPVTWPVSAWMSKSANSPDCAGYEECLIVLGPSIAVGYVLGNVTGGAAWLICGWW